MSSLNLGILAHIDAGKTSLTERLLYAAGVIDEVGSVDAGTTQTDSLALERQRGITIKSAVVSFAIGDTTVNLIDTPGHPDFIAEVERVLSVRDGAVLVVAAVEGVQAQTGVLMRTLRRLRIPTLISVNKVDRRGADPARVLGELTDKLGLSVIPMAAPSVEPLAEHNEELLAAYVGGETLTPQRLHAELAEQTGRVLVHPVYAGSAITGAGTDELRAGIVSLLPAASGDAAGPVSGTVFKVERGPAGEKIAYVRMFSGTLRVRDRVHFGDHQDGKVTAISVFDSGAAVRSMTVSAGQIGKLWGLPEIRIGDVLGEPRTTGEHHFSPPTLETIVVPCRAVEKGALHAALTQLAESDPLINLRLDEMRQEISVSLYGEVQKEVIEATLADEFGLVVSFRETTTICLEKPAGVGVAFEIIDVAPNPFLATVGLRIEPAPAGSGVEFRLGVELGSMPY